MIYISLVGQNNLLELVSGCCSATGVRKDDTKMVGKPEKKKIKRLLMKELAHISDMTRYFRLAI